LKNIDIFNKIIKFAKCLTMKLNDSEKNRKYKLR